MLQFIAALVMGINAIIIGCDFPMWMQYSCCAYMLSFLVLFSDFYVKVKNIEVVNSIAGVIYSTETSVLYHAFEKMFEASF